ncbi:class B sortase [Enterocloster clostridioformis]|nr:hypothetical protein A4V08_03040 [Lachnoclostridium sp. YL32]NDO27676.1 class B sortase [Enterocloster clostridioformis]OXE70140.1 class B sortase [Enterocloster clostridioformis]QQR00283.1 class B sortase [Enterocloster clostridioformis]
MKKDRMLSVLVVIAVIFMIICGCRLIWLILRYQEADNLYADIGEEVLMPELPSEDDENPGEENEVKQAVDFQKLLSINKEVVAWISIPALELEYPVTQGEDNEYYLHYAYNKEPNFAGSIFLDFRNHADFQAQNTILYGHNMLNGSMFGSLKHLDVSTHPKIIVYTPEAVLEYEAVDNGLSVYQRRNIIRPVSRGRIFWQYCRDFRRRSAE